MAKSLVVSIEKLTEQDDKENADSVLQLALAENRRTFERIKEDEIMCQALADLMKPEMDAAIAETEKRTKATVFYNLVSDGTFTESEAAEKAGMTEAEFRQAYTAAGLA